MRVAVAGKGGSGKTTIAGTLARSFARKGYRVLAIDNDVNPNLAITLGIARGVAAEIVPLPHNLLEERTDSSGNRTFALAISPDAIAERYGVKAGDDVTLLLMGRADHAGVG